MDNESTNESTFAAVFELQSLDIEIDSATRRIENNKLTDEIYVASDNVSKIRDSHTELLDRQQTVSSQISKTTPKLVDLRLKRENLQAKIYDGSVTSQKELDSISSSIDFVSAELDELETQQLEEMEALDALDAEVLTSQGTLDVAQEDLGNLERDLAEDISAATESLDELTVKRNKLANACDADLLAVYQGLRDNAVQKPFARLIDKKCDGCNMAVAAVNIDRLKNSTDSVENCDECGRVLVLMK